MVENFDFFSYPTLLIATVGVTKFEFHEVVYCWKTTMFRLPHAEENIRSMQYRNVRDG